MSGKLFDYMLTFVMCHSVLENFLQILKRQGFRATPRSKYEFRKFWEINGYANILRSEIPN